MKRIDYLEVAGKALEIIPKGAFLTVRAQDRLNTMTIGWATIGYVWREPVFMVAVRTSRHTHGLLEDAEDFTVSIPLSDFKKELEFCGTRSGRDLDKFSSCSLRTAEGQKVKSPVIRMAGIHFECRIIFKAPMDEANLVEQYRSLYPHKDYHTLYFGKIVDCYETEEAEAVCEKNES